MDKRAELAELAAQFAEHLRYRQELGIEFTGEEAIVRKELSRSSAKEPALLEVLPTQSGTSSQPADLFLRLPSESESLDQIRADLGECKRCKLWSTRTNIVFGEGSPNAELMFIGEGPGADEDASGRPFVGKAGQLLTKMIEAIGLKRSDVYIANVVKSRPPGNRAPEKDEVDACSPFLLRQIAAIHPKLIVTLGNPATQSLLKTKRGITVLRGQLLDYPQLPDIKVIPTFHPAYLLRDPSKKKETWQDLQLVQSYLAG
jgi:DNA polymerase